MERSGKLTIGARAFLAGLLFMAAGFDQARGADPFEQNLRLGRGVNVLGYDPIWWAADKARFQARHFRMIREAGFNTVRINLFPFRHMGGAPNFAIAESWLKTADWAVTQATQQNLMVILDLHEFMAMAAKPEKNRAKFISAWRQLAEHFREAPETVLFEVLNEPNTDLTPELWNEYLAEALSTIRQTNPRRTIVAGPAFWNSLHHLREFKIPASETNLIVTVHYYEPMTFTHQGAKWVTPAAPTGVEWKGSEAELGKIKKDLDEVERWSHSEHRPIFLGEFGAYDLAPMESRARYVSAVARAAEARKWSWAYWQFDSDFVLYDMKKQQWVEPLREALFPK